MFSYGHLHSPTTFSNYQPERPFPLVFPTSLISRLHICLGFQKKLHHLQLLVKHTGTERSPAFALGCQRGCYFDAFLAFRICKDFEGFGNPDELGNNNTLGIHHMRGRAE